MLSLFQKHGKEFYKVFLKKQLQSDFKMGNGNSYSKSVGIIKTGILQLNQMEKLHTNST